MNKEKDIIQLFKKNNGFLTTSKLYTKGFSKYEINKLIDNDTIIRIKRGLYKLAENNNVNVYEEINKIIPKGIFCLFSAWRYYDLTTYIPHEQHIAIFSKSKVALPEYPPIKIYYWTKETYELGVVSEKFKIYDLEKSVCDAIRYRTKIGNDILNEILKTYLKRKDKNLDKLMKYAIKLNISNILKQYLDILI
jgi:predicted transcriptional regulator of viral defense system